MVLQVSSLESQKLPLERQHTERPVVLPEKTYNLGDAPVNRTGLSAIDAPVQVDDRRAEAEGVASQFEQLFVQQIIEGMRKGAEALGEGGVFEGTVGDDTYTKWFDQHMTAHLTDPSATGSARLGITDAILEDLERHRQLAPLPEDATARAPAPHLDRPTVELHAFERNPIRAVQPR